MLRRCCAILVCTAALTGIVAPAAAHSGGAVMEVVTADGADDLAVEVTVDVAYEGDGEPADRAFVTVTPRDDSGRRLEPIDLDRATGGRYIGTIELDQPGRWILDVTSAFPPGSTTIDIAVGGGASGGAAPILTSAAAAVLALVIFVVWRRRRRAGGVI